MKNKIGKSKIKKTISFKEDADVMNLLDQMYSINYCMDILQTKWRKLGVKLNKVSMKKYGVSMEEYTVDLEKMEFVSK